MASLVIPPTPPQIDTLQQLLDSGMGFGINADKVSVVIFNRKRKTIIITSIRRIKGAIDECI